MKEKGNAEIQAFLLYNMDKAVSIYKLKIR